jgi:HD-GYP domain-containing protein (c-di-GMP phosphodiesterase class II)
MLKKIKSRDLKLGMYVVFPDSWSNHPFFRNRFVIKSKMQIEKIINYGISEITIDISKGLDHHDSKTPPPEKWEPAKLISDDLKKAMYDKKLSPKARSKAVYSYSTNVVNNLFENPTAENLKEGKEHISEVVDVILKDDETSGHLLNITSHDFYTFTHSVNVGMLSIMLSKVLIKDYSIEQMHELGAGFFLHDLGKVNIDPAIINNPGLLTEQEMNQMRTHPFQGFKLLKKADQLSEECKVIVMQHHERENGAGYPKGLMGDKIHLYGRICSIADVFDALTSERSYKKKLNRFEALKLMIEEMHDHFDKRLLDAFVLLFK